MDKKSILHVKLHNTIDVNLEIYDRVTVITGDSGSGRTFLFNKLQTMEAIKEQSKLFFINYKNRKDIEKLKSLHDKIIFIDNADIVLSDDDRRRIRQDTKNIYILFGRNFDGLSTGVWNIAELISKNNKMYLNFFMVGMYVY